ncbi:helix-turn-helix transcriptional regulator [Parasphingorhabdus cellanae]|uniref:Helix-turn-helix transcriptional regulator n=1 Tax=Parasphingorhabdus cellanae TaxID=2806553 RepID=A0ABX7T2A6_9SPHN|nr:helix-turn-helix transcriptional regulator [Parasphingorhabdus cellanae]QTD54935.1 helix-turn-helix transcriptional regulator [Parasphingorhabdus cellanae]
MASRYAPWMHYQLLEKGPQPRHRHSTGYAAFILSGTYEELGDTGRWQAEAGDIVYHHQLEAHANRVSSSCSIINIPVPGYLALPPMFQVEHPDDLLKALLLKSLVNCDEDIMAILAPHQVKQPVIGDWPDMLARDLLEAPTHLTRWANQAGIRPETVTRGFFKAYGTTPARYRREAQTRRALREIICSDCALADIAYRTGFADQAHLTRSVVGLTGTTPRAWRKVKTVQYGYAAG